ncbi:MAG TPA: patatin-like phospholipase family protein [Lacunisphaera sp.]
MSHSRLLSGTFASLLSRACRSSASGALTLALGWLTGCVHAPINQPLITLNQDVGYRVSNALAEDPAGDEVFVILAFSGGGTRAAAFSYGAMEKLAATPITLEGKTRSLLDEVDIISSVSGGSFTSAYYALHRKKGDFDTFPDRFLYRNVRTALALGLINPFNWPKLFSPFYDRIDMAADYYDRTVFDHQTFGDLAAISGRPFIVLNATDMSLGSRFEFTQDQFDYLGSDLSSYPVARGVASSSAFPFLLSPLTLKNYPGFPDQAWIATALKDRERNPRDFAYATAMQSYGDKDRRPFIHLLDGGLADNIGLRGPAYALFSSKNAWARTQSSQRPWSLVQLLNTKKIKYLVVITVNAKTSVAPNWDVKQKAPGISGMMSVVTSAPMGNYSDETVQYVHDQLEARQQLMDDSNPVKFYAIELMVGDIKDAAERDRLNAIPTDFQISRDAVNELRKAAGELLDQSEAFQRLRADLGSGANAEPGKEGAKVRQ